MGNDIKLFTCNRWMDLYQTCWAYATDSYNNSAGLPDTYQVVGARSGIVMYHQDGTSISTGQTTRAWHWLIFFTQTPTNKLPPRTVLFRIDTWRGISAPQGSNRSITVDGVSYICLTLGGLSHNLTTDQWYCSNDRIYDVTIMDTSGDVRSTVYDLGDRTNYTDAQIREEALRYLLGETEGVENLYVGVNGKAQQVKKLYVGVNGKAQEVKAIYVGVNGKAQKVF